MKSRLFLLISFLFVERTSFSQDITRQDVDSMINALNKGKQGIDRVYLLLNLAQFHIFKPGELEVDLDSATIYINEAKALNRSLKSSIAYGYQMLTESFLTKERGKKDEGKKMVENAINILKTGANKDYLGRAYYELSTYFDYTDSLQLFKRIDLVEKSIDDFRQAGDLKRIGQSLEMLGDLYGETGDFNKTTQTLKESLAAYDSIKYQRLQGVYALLGASYLFLGHEYGQALFYLLKSLKAAQLTQDTSIQLCQINNYLGVLYNEIGRSDMAVGYLGDALAIARKYNDDLSIYLLATNMASTFNELDEPEKALKALGWLPQKYFLSDDPIVKATVGQCYLRAYVLLEQLGGAQIYCDTLLKVADKKIGDLARDNIYRLVASYFFFTKQYPKAHYYLVKSDAIATKISHENGRIQNLQLLYKLDSAQGNFQSAFNELLLYKAKTDSVSSERKVREFQVLGVEYEVGVKEDSIRLKDKDILLLTQRNSLQQANLKQASLIKNITIVGIILAFIIIALLYRQFRLKQKSNQVITQKNQQLQHYLNEKEWLLKEIHHRVKNNLQIVMSLLNSQSAYIDNDVALTAIHDSEHRVQAMSLIHQKLYHADNVSSIDISVYVRELASYLSDSFDTGRRIRFEIDIEPLEMDVSQAVPLGLILNEAITNSIKYAFPDMREGLISIVLSNASDDLYFLRVSDNGVGLPANYKKSGSLGMSLMKGLSEDLDGSFSIENHNGTTIKISFAYDKGFKKPGTFASSFSLNN